ncbi:MAG: glutamate-5-semialdehyde dehydrogenase [Chloroflexi bacterium]|nr:glutamate-5-semialdehyde dehydrogenase [Chloroflexota bacterium]
MKRFSPAPELLTVEQICKRAKDASRLLAHIETAQKNLAIEKIALQLHQDQKEILSANALDLEEASRNGLSEALLDRLMLDEKRLAAVITDLDSVTKLPDPIGEVMEEQTLANGLKIYKRRVPLGVLGVIYEARPNVTVDVAGLTLKSGNCAVLRGGSETLRTNLSLVQAIQRGLRKTALPSDSIQLISDSNRTRVHELLQMDRYVNLIIPRGGAGLHEFCRQNSRIPVITGGIGICHLFVDESADLERAIEVIRNAKIQRPTVCNALDTTLVHKAVAAKFLPLLVDRLSLDRVTFRADQASMTILEPLHNPGVQSAGVQDFDTEWLSLVLGLKIVQDLEEAIAHINNHSTSHSDGILTENSLHAAQFLEQVDSAAVYVNASTRFTDGSQLGLGAEIAISTQRLHARGPMGLRELTTYKWVIQGNYNLRP